MLLKPTTGKNAGTAGLDDALLAANERCLTLLIDGAARGAVEVEAASYAAFRANLENLSRRISDRLPEEEKLALIRSINQEFENYRSGSETALRERTSAWRAALTLLLEELIHDLGLDATSAKIAPLIQQLKKIGATDEIRAWHEAMQTFLHPIGLSSPAEEMTARLRTADCSTANDNASGLRGGGAALEHLRRIMTHNGEGYIVLFQLSCLDIVSQRFGGSAVEDCLMAVSAYLTAGLDSQDAIYHWSDSALLAILQGRASEPILHAELERILAQNRESTIKISGRPVMLRIPISFQITPIHNLSAPEDLLRISARPKDSR